MGETVTADMTDRRQGGAWALRWWSRCPRGWTTVLDRWPRCLTRRRVVVQPIETGGKRQGRIQAARAATCVMGFEVDDMHRQIATQGKQAFTDALLAHALLAAISLTCAL